MLLSDKSALNACPRRTVEVRLVMQVVVESEVGCDGALALVPEDEIATAVAEGMKVPSASGYVDDDHCWEVVDVVAVDAVLR